MRSFDEIEKLVVESRPPVLYVMGRSGHGKSSLINALAGRKVAEVDDIKPRTIGAEPHYISFPEFYAEWEIVDSRGIFETTSPEGAPQQDALTQVKEDIRRHKPDVVLHVMFLEQERTVRMGVPPFRIELLTTISGVEFGECRAARVMDVVDRVEIPLISLKDPKTNRAASGRSKDVNDLENLP